MNKIIQVQKKELLVIKTVLFLLVVSCFSSSTSDDKAVVGYIAEQLYTITTDTLYLKIDTSNKGLEEYLDEDIASGDLVRREKSLKWLGKRTDEAVNKEIAILEKVFTPENRVYFKTQMGDYKWDKRINTGKLIIQPKGKKPNVYISKPVYSQDNKYAVVGYSYGGIYALQILENSSGKWIGIKHIDLWMS
jgi:hypothetical protein